MWPLLLELLPHFSRLLPAWDKYLAGRNASDKAHEAALAALSAEVRGELGKVTEEHAALRRELQEQNAQVSAEAARARMAIESVEERVAKLEKVSATTVKLLVVALVFLAGVSALLIALLLKLKAH